MPDPRIDDVVFVMYVHSRPGVLAKIASMFYRRGLNIGTLTVGATREPELSKMVARVSGARGELERVALAIDNLVDVLSVELADGAALPAHELCLVRVAATDASARAAVLAAAASFEPSVVDVSEDSVVLEAAGTPAAMERFLAACAPFSVLDISRTGVTTRPGRHAPSLSG